MLLMFKNDLFEKYNIGSYLYALLLGCMNPDSNRIELKGVALNSVDLCAYANLTMQELSKAVRELYKLNVLLCIRAKGKEFYYVNPRCIREESRDVFSYEWLLELFDEEANNQDKDFIYFKRDSRRGKRMRVSINCGDNLHTRKEK